MVEVYKTSITSPIAAAAIVGLLHVTFEGTVANFDLEDCDHILRLAAPDPATCLQAERLLRRMGISLKPLNDPSASDIRRDRRAG